MVLEVGEKYVSIKIVGHDFIKAFPNKKKEKPNAPSFVGDGVAVWVHEKQASNENTEELIE